MRGDCVLDGKAASQGMAGLQPEAFEPVLLALIEPWLVSGGVMPVLACGMVGARRGWIEAPYAQTPCAALDPGRAVRAPVRDPRLAVWVLPGLSQIDPADVMRGEETQIAGLLTREPDFDGTVCLPGTHSKWVRLKDGRVLAFRTMMTGELFGLLSRQSVLRLSTTPNDAADWDEAGFDDGVREGLSAPGAGLAGLFSIRARGLMQSESQASAKARLSGLLIGSEVAAMEPHWNGQDLVIVGAPELVALYQRALVHAGAKVRMVAADDLVLLGLSSARAAMKNEPGAPPGQKPPSALATAATLATQGPERGATTVRFDPAKGDTDACNSR